MTARLRELAERMSQLRTYIANAPDDYFGIGSDRSSGYVRNYSVRDNLLCMIDAINSILDAEGDGGAVTELVRTAPEQIYLQISDDESDHEEAFPADHGDEITWCADSVLDCEVKYIRSDLVTRHGSAGSGGVSDATWRDPTGFSVAGILDEANNWTRRETGKQMLLNYAAALEHFAKGERHDSIGS